MGLLEELNKAIQVKKIMQIKDFFGLEHSKNTINVIIYFHHHL